MSYQYIIYEKKGHIAYVTINRPEVMNALICRMEEFDSPIDMTRLAETYNVRPTPFVEFVRRQHEELAHVGPEWLYA